MAINSQWKRGAILFVIGTGSFMSSLDGAITSIIVPVIQQDFSTTVPAVQWVTLAFLVTVSGFLPLFGRLGDLWGHRQIYLSGILAFTLSSLLCGISPTISWLILFRICQAMGAAMIIAVAPAILTMNYPPERRGRILGLQLTMTYLGLIAGPSLGGFVTHFWVWRAAFWINIPIGFLLLTATLWIVPPTGRGQQERLDVAGALLLFAAIILFLVGITRGGGMIAPRQQPFLILAGIIFGFLFVRRELRRERREEPVLLRMSLFRNRTFSLSAGVALIGYTCEFFIAFLVPFYLTQVLRLSISIAGLLFTAKSAVMVFVAPWAGNASDRLGSRPLSLAAMGCYLVSLAFQSQLTAQSSIIWIVALLILSGIATGLFVSPNNSTMMGSAPRSAQGVASALLGLMRNFGMSFGVAFSGALLALRPGGLLDGFQFAMGWGSLIAAAGIVLSALQKRVSRNEDRV